MKFKDKQSSTKGGVKNCKGQEGWREFFMVVRRVDLINNKGKKPE